MNVEGQFTFGGVKYDNVNGIGAVPNNSNVVYMGFAAIMKVDEFLSFATSADRLATARSMADAIIDEDAAIGSPFLKISEEEDGWVVDGHEGRGRATAVKLLAEGYRSEDQKTRYTGDVVVHFFPLYKRARDMNSEFFNDLKVRGLQVERSSIRKRVPTPFRVIR